jgi:hypothetical protein
MHVQSAAELEAAAPQRVVRPNDDERTRAGPQNGAVGSEKRAPRDSNPQRSDP